MPGGLTFPALKFWMVIKFDFSLKTGILVVKFAFATANLKIETLRMRRRFARVLTAAEIWEETQVFPMLKLLTNHSRLVLNMQIILPR